MIRSANNAMSPIHPSKLTPKPMATWIAYWASKSSYAAR